MPNNILSPSNLRDLSEPLVLFVVKINHYGQKDFTKNTMKELKLIGFYT